VSEEARESTHEVERDTCERCGKPVPLESNGLYFCRECRMAWMPARKNP
jgi:hypothetical protein